MRTSIGLPRHLLTITLGGVAIFFILVPLALYSIFRQAHQEREDIVIRGLQAESRIIADAISQALAGDEPTIYANARRELLRFADADAHVRLLFRRNDAQSFDFQIVGANPPLDEAGLAKEHAALVRQGLIDDAVLACAGGGARIRNFQEAAGSDIGLAAINPVRSAGGCWALLFSYPAAQLAALGVATPLWQRREVQEAAVIYLALTSLTVVLYFAMRNSLMGFGRVARAMSQGVPSDKSFLEQSQVSELDDIATEFDHLVETLKRGSERLRQRAEDSAHALKSPVAVMRQSLVPLQREAANDQSVKRALDVMSQTVERLDNLVDEARRVDDSVAELADPPRRRVDLSRMLRQMLGTYGDVAVGRGVELEADLPAGVTVAGSEKLIASALQAVLDEVIVSSSPGRRVEVQVLRNSLRTEIAVAGGGAPIGPEQRWRIFGPAPAAGRKPSEFPEEAHAGLGLRTARQKLEAMGGGIHVENAGEGVLVYLDLPVVGAPPSGRRLRRDLVLGLRPGKTNRASA